MHYTDYLTEDIKKLLLESENNKKLFELILKQYSDQIKNQNFTTIICDKLFSKKINFPYYQKDNYNVDELSFKKYKTKSTKTLFIPFLIWREIILPDLLNLCQNQNWQGFYWLACWQHYWQCNYLISKIIDSVVKRDTYNDTVYSMLKIAIPLAKNSDDTGFLKKQFENYKKHLKTHLN